MNRLDKEDLDLGIPTEPGKCVQGLEQSEAVMRLGLRLAFNPRRCSLHFQLNVANPEHAEVAKKLVDMAQKVLNQSHCVSLGPIRGVNRQYLRQCQ